MNLAPSPAPRSPSSGKPLDILLVEDSGVDRLLVAEALREFRVANQLHCVVDGEEAMEFLRARGRHPQAPRPDIVLLDLNLPRKDGREVLTEIKADPALKAIPVVVLTTSSARADVLGAYAAHANSYITKPVGFGEMSRMVRALEDFWCGVATLPPRPAVATEAAPSGGAPARSEEFRRVLLIEDSAGDALLFARALAEPGATRFAVERVERLETALERLRAGGWDAVVADLNLPDSSGLETLRRVRRAAGATPVVVLTVLDDERLGHELLREGASDCVIKGELGARALARVVRQAADRARAEAGLEEARRLEGIGLLAGGVAHDFNNLLTIIRGNAELLASTRLSPAEAAESARQIVRAAERGAAITRQLLTYGRRDRLHVEAVELNATLAGLGEALRRLLGPEIELELRLGAEALPLLADAAMIEQVVRNLALNARDAMPEGGRLVVETRRVDLGAAGAGPRPPAGPGLYACLLVRDTGCGIPPDVLPHVFEPFFTTKAQTRGAGLGLAAVYGAVRQHRGEVEARSEPGRGAEFSVWLPLAAASA